MFTARWRWNLGRALAVLRMRGGKRNPPPIQRMEADDLMAAVFPGLAQCQENQAGPIEIPDHPLVRQTLDDCLHEAMDVDALAALLAGVEAGGVALHLRETTEPSPLAHEILNGRPFTFLDDAPLEERRTRAVVLRRGLPETARDLGRLDADAIARVREEAAPAPRDAEELHDLLLSFVLLPPSGELEPWLAELARDGRAARVATAEGELWCASSRRSPHRRGCVPRASSRRWPGSRPRASRCAAASRPTRPRRNSARAACSRGSICTRRSACAARSSP
jgi:ATP-dependent Lhr-like helicase